MFCSNGLNWDTACSLHHGLQHISHYWLLLGFDRMHLKSSIVDLTKGDPPNGSRAQPTHVFHHCSSPPIWSTQPILQAEIHNQSSRLKYTTSHPGWKHTQPSRQVFRALDFMHNCPPGAMFGHSIAPQVPCLVTQIDCISCGVYLSGRCFLYSIWFFETITELISPHRLMWSVWILFIQDTCTHVQGRLGTTENYRHSLCAFGLIIELLNSTWANYYTMRVNYLQLNR